MKRELVLGNVMVDCGDEKALQRFYHELLGWKKCEQWERPAVRSASGFLLLFCEELDYVPPMWPERPGAQQKQMHFDFQVEDLSSAVERAERLGAVKTTKQFGGEEFVTLLDPAGHPFCLCKI